MKQEDSPTSDSSRATEAAATVAAPRFSTLLSLAWPIVVSRSAQAIVGFCDALMVATLGEEALAATTTGSFNTFFVFMLPIGTVFIVSSFTSQLHGRGEIKAAKRYGWYGIAIAAAAGAAIAFTTPLVPLVVNQLSIEASVRELMIGYMVVRLMSAGVAVGLEALANYYAGLGNTRLPMAAQLIAMTLNIVFNWVFIFGNLGAMKLGVIGAAWASVLATTVAFFALFFCFLFDVGVPAAPESTSGSVEETLNETADDAPKEMAAETATSAGANAKSGRWKVLREIGQMLRFGLPAGLNWFLEMGAFVFFLNVVVADLGTTGLAAMNAVIQLNSIAFMPAFGLASAGAILVGQGLGRKRIDHAKLAVKFTLLAAATWQLFVGFVYLLVPDLLMGTFVDDPAKAEGFLDLGVRMLMLSTAWQLFDAIAGVLTEALRAAGDTAFTLWARIAIAWFIFVPASLVWVRAYDGGEVAAVICLVIYMMGLATVLSWRYRSGRWQSISLFGDDA